MKITVTLDRTYYDKNNVEIQYGDILKIDKYPYFDDINNYYGIVMWHDESEDVVVRTTLAANSIVTGLSDGNCEYITVFDICQNKHIDIFEVIGNVKNKKDVKKYLVDDTWVLDDCLP